MVREEKEGAFLGDHFTIGAVEQQEHKQHEQAQQAPTDHCGTN